jgi:hypothetical protein
MVFADPSVVVAARAVSHARDHFTRSHLLPGNRRAPKGTASHPRRSERKARGRASRASGGTRPTAKTSFFHEGSIVACSKKSKLFVRSVAFVCAQYA